MICALTFLLPALLSADPVADFQNGREAFKARNYERAFELLKQSAQELSPVRDFSYYYLGVSAENLKQKTVALQVYQDLLAHYPGFPLAQTVQNKIKSLSPRPPAVPEVTPDATTPQRQYQYAQFLERRRQYSEAEAWYQKLAESFRGEATGISALDSLALLYRKQDKDALAIQTYAQFVARYPQHWLSQEAYFQMGRLSLAAGQIASANAFLEHATAYNVSKLIKAETRFLLAETYRKLGRQKEEQSLLRKIVEEEPVSYYGFLCQQLLAQPLTELPRSREEISVDERYWTQQIPRVELFQEIGDSEVAGILANAYLQQYPTSNLSLPLFVVRLYEQDENFGAAQRTGERIWDTYARANRLSQLPEQFWKISYPLYYWDQLRSLAKAQGFDPLFALALIREESRFKADVVSYAGAVGLMQLMPFTAAAEIRKHRLEPGELTDPGYNIQVGILHLGYLLNAYKGNTSYALAAYNGGINATNRWIQATRDLPAHEFTERVDYEQSRNYIKKVLKSYWIYRQLYKE